ncbi:hypothetical protein ACWNT8_14735 [Pigmentibacter ruber]|uniref:hypothetical protein n=1 Tax=Pigmentibacter ruber TaxID=2683196 RepID=UPI00131E1D52|nr:hypothetical protein [Pigmentibacter ruber]
MINKYDFFVKEFIKILEFNVQVEVKNNKCYYNYFIIGKELHFDYEFNSYEINLNDKINLLINPSFQLKENDVLTPEKIFIDNVISNKFIIVDLNERNYKKNIRGNYLKIIKQIANT